MKKLAIYGFALTTAFLTACSNETTSSTPIDYVSCHFNQAASNEESPLFCIQMPKSFKDSLYDLCYWESKYEGAPFSMRDTECDNSFLVKKECVDPQNSAISYLIYNTMMSWLDCEKDIIMNEDRLETTKNWLDSVNAVTATAEAEEQAKDEAEQMEAIQASYEAVDAYAAGDVDAIDNILEIYNHAYNIPEKRCVKYNPFLQLSDLNAAIGKRHSKLDSLGKGVIAVSSCEEVAETPVAICADNNTHIAVTVYFYDPAQKGKKCKDLITFVPKDDEE